MSKLLMPTASVIPLSELDSTKSIVTPWHGIFLLVYLVSRQARIERFLS